MKNISNSDYYYNRWNKQREFILSSDSIDKETKENIKNALFFLEGELGKSFFKSFSLNHPLKRKILNSAEWQVLNLIEFVETLKILKEYDSNYPKLLAKLLSETSSDEAVAFVEIAKMYHKQNFQLSFLEEANKSKVRTPDIKVFDTENGFDFYIEVSELNESKALQKSGEINYFFVKEFHYKQPQFPFFGRQKTEILESDYEDIRKIIIDAKNKVLEHNQIVSYSDKRFEFVIVPNERADELEEVCSKSNGRLHDIDGLPIQLNETDRIIRGQIREKKAQIPEGSNGLLYIVINPVFFMIEDIIRSITKIEQSVSDSKNLIGVVLFTKIVADKEEVRQKAGKHFFSRRMVKNLCHELLFIHNSNCDVIISELTMEKIYKTFI